MENYLDYQLSEALTMINRSRHRSSGFFLPYTGQTKTPTILKLSQLPSSSKEAIEEYRYHVAKDIYSEGFNLDIKVNKQQRLNIDEHTCHDIFPLEAAVCIFNRKLIKDLLDAGATEESSAEIQLNNFFKQCKTEKYEDKSKIIGRIELIAFLINECGLTNNDYIEDVLQTLHFSLKNYVKNILSEDGYKKLISYDPKYAMELRISNFRDLNKFGYAPLHIAAKFGDVTLIQELVDEGADINLKGRIDTKVDHTPLYYAAFYGRLEAVQWLKARTDLSKNKDDIEEVHQLAMSYQKCSVSLFFWKAYQNSFVSPVDYKGVVNALNP